MEPPPPPAEDTLSLADAADPIRLAAFLTEAAALRNDEITVLRSENESLRARVLELENQTPHSNHTIQSCEQDPIMPPPHARSHILSREDRVRKDSSDTEEREFPKLSGVPTGMMSLDDEAAIFENMAPPSSPSTLLSISRRSNSLDAVRVWRDVYNEAVDRPSRSPTRPRFGEMKNSSVITGEKASFHFRIRNENEGETFKPKEKTIRTIHQSTMDVKMIWRSPPRNVLVVKKPNDPESYSLFVDVTAWLREEPQCMNVIVEPLVHKELVSELKAVTHTWQESQFDMLHKSVDMVVCLGGDGTVIWVSNMFKGPCPPCIAFATGSLGFNTPFPASTFRHALRRFISEGAVLSLRSRVNAAIIRCGEDASGCDKPAESDYADLPTAMVALNEIVIDKGPQHQLTNLVVRCHDGTSGSLLTRVMADGLIIGTPTGSTAYSLAAGGPIVHPSVPAMLFTPICPHTLSFRPMILPDHVTLSVEVPMESRATAWAAGDGKHRTELRRGDRVVCRVSPFPLPFVCESSERGDWLAACTKSLSWNSRKEQKPHGPSL